VDAIASGADVPVLPLFRPGVEKPRIPHETTTMVRPSIKSTARVSSVTMTFFTRSPGLISEICIPFLHQAVFVVPEYLLYPPKLHRTESEVENQADRLQPELRGLVVTTHVNVRRLVWFVARK
jgi:hypothetical protein